MNRRDRGGHTQSNGTEFVPVTYLYTGENVIYIIPTPNFCVPKIPRWPTKTHQNDPIWDHFLHGNNGYSFPTYLRRCKKAI